MVLLRENDNFNGWEKIKTKRIIGDSVKTYIDRKVWLKPDKEAVIADFESDDSLMSRILLYVTLNKRRWTENCAFRVN